MKPSHRIALVAGLLLLAAFLPIADYAFASPHDVMNLWSGEGQRWRADAPMFWPDVQLPAMAASAAPMKSPLLTTLLGLHIVGLLIGFGGALFLDFYLFGFLYRHPIAEETIALLKFGEKVVAVGLALLWTSGIGFLVYYALNNAPLLANPKLGAKILIVAALTFNGYAIHRIAMPLARQSIGMPLLAERSLASALPLLLIAAVSLSSWSAAFILGLVRQLNFVVPFGVLFLVYLAAIAVTVCAAMALHTLMTRPLPIPSISAPSLVPALSRAVHALDVRPRLRRRAGVRRRAGNTDLKRSPARLLGPDIAIRRLVREIGAI